jgi:hypothetical protein
MAAREGLNAAPARPAGRKLRRGRTAAAPRQACGGTDGSGWTAPPARHPGGDAKVPDGCACTSSRRRRRRCRTAAPARHPGESGDLRPERHRRCGSASIRSPDLRIGEMQRETLILLGSDAAASRPAARVMNSGLIAGSRSFSSSSAVRRLRAGWGGGARGAEPCVCTPRRRKLRSGRTTALHVRHAAGRTGGLDGSACPSPRARPGFQAGEALRVETVPAPAVRASCSPDLRIDPIPRGTLLLLGSSRGRLQFRRARPGLRETVA